MRMSTNHSRDWKRIRTNFPLDLKPRTDLNKTSVKNYLLQDGLVSPTYYEFAKSVIETNSKVREPQIYNKAITNFVDGNRWQKATNDALWYLDIYQTCNYTSLPLRQKTIGYKYGFKVKYDLDGSIKRYKARLITQEFSQVQKIDYIKTFTPTIRCKLLRIFFAIIIMLRIILM